MNDSIVAPTLEQLTSAWLSEKLQTVGFADVKVKRFHASKVGDGQMAKCMRLTLDYETRHPEYPASLIVKLPSDDPTSRATGALALTYPREVGFYNHLQDKIAIATPACYYAALGDTNSDFIILMEDLAPAKQLDQVDGCSSQLAQQAVLQLAGLHGPTWCDERYFSAKWLVAGEPDGMYLFCRISYEQLLPNFCDQFKDGLDKAELDVFEGLLNSANDLIVAPSEDLFSVAHLDYRLDNLLIDQSFSPPKVTAVDWQTIYVSSPLADVAYFLGASLLIDDRRESEKQIVAAYHQALLDQNVSISWDTCWNEYRKGTFHGLLIAVLSSTLVGKTDRRDLLLTTMAKRHVRHVLDLGATEFLS